VYTAAAGSGAWELQQKLSGNAFGLSMDSFFGTSVALNAAGDTLAVGAPHHSWNKGAGIVFGLSGSVWGAQSPILMPATVNSVAGSSIALNAAGDLLALGSNGDSTQELSGGAVYTYKRNSTGVWNYGQRLLPSDYVTTFNRAFGYSLALSSSGSTLVVGGMNEGVMGAWWSGQTERTRGGHAHPAWLTALGRSSVCLLFPFVSVVSFIVCPLLGTLSPTAPPTIRSV